MKLLAQAKKTAKGKEHFNDLCDCLGDLFYPEYGSFTKTLDDYSALKAQTSGYPSQARRDLSQSISTMLRPTSKVWFKMTGRFDYGKKDKSYKELLEDKTKELYHYMYDSRSGLNTATVQCDNAFVSFGQGVYSVWWNKKGYLSYIPHHLREFSWLDDESGNIVKVFRDWKPEIRILVSMFGLDKLSKETQELYKHDETKEIPCLHCVRENPDYIIGKSKKYIHTYIEKNTEHEISEAEIGYNPYVIPRWHRIANKPYAFSPSAICALPDANLLQVMSATLINAGQLAVSPPLIGQQNAILSGDNNLSLKSEHIIWVDDTYDERTGDAVRPFPFDLKGIPYGFEIQTQVNEAVHKSFFLNKIALPELRGSVTAYEIAQRVEEWVRNTLPLIEPISAEYNNKHCTASLGALTEAGVMDMSELPANIEFNFQNPLTEGIEAAKVNTFRNVLEVVDLASQFDNKQSVLLNINDMTRDAVEASGSPLAWIKDEDEVEKLQKEMADAEQDAKDASLENAQATKTNLESAKNIKDIENES